MLRTDPESFSDVMTSFEEYSLSFIFKGNKQKIQCLSSIQSLRIGQKSNVMRGFYVDLTDPLRLSSSSVLRVDPSVTSCLTSDPRIVFDNSICKELGFEAPRIIRSTGGPG